MANAGVYEIRNTINGHRYIGGSVDLSARIRSHKNALLTHKHRNVHLQRAWNKYGEKYFIFTSLLYCDSEMTLLYEQMCLDGLYPEYNIAEDAKAPWKGRSLSEETKRKLSDALTGRTLSDEHKRKISSGGKGRVLSEEHRRKVGISKIGNQYWSGRHHTEDAKAKIKSTLMGHSVTEEARLKMSASHKGIPMSEETKSKLSVAGKGNQNARKKRGAS